MKESGPSGKAFVIGITAFVGMGVAAAVFGPGPPAPEIGCIGPARDARGWTFRVYAPRSVPHARFPLTVATQGGQAAEIEIDPIRRIVSWPSGRRSVFPPGRGILLVAEDGGLSWTRLPIPFEGLNAIATRLRRDREGANVGDLLYQMARAVDPDRLDRPIQEFAEP